ncbi:restriction endonuclease [Leptospira sp. 2 VSF19]|uniref:Restriction endonuclease n=1 Tax=Leptospira soteropolitanensis TaxID=2950025 RepID=A0AAW5VDW9_9LEPT|nr:restriction endonuclease [Leptospira soteropolitanensis]MCW7492395.1 restriction endonuclease [Leptospira soteropolitanensis]MCW7499975.1 restriction endonuclease [Leptospira soteropolitanensis]MCW7522227.1 restriction endonuclease [Leptospira soteropolitanensis]MCW7526082.1 restriction endonuclease [Leptospira soteropolitanensis]MCW7529806.1 restriction endonuclease [Leptospira soteropolitanensis]
MAFFIFVGAAVIMLGFLLTFIVGQRRDSYAKALSLATLGNFLDARALVREKLEEDHQNPYGHYVMAKIYAMENDPLNEAKHLEIIKKNNRYTKEIDAVTVSNRIADIYYNKDFFEEAFFHYLDTIQVDRSNPVACLRLGFMALGQKEFKIAEHFFSRIPEEKINLSAYFIARGVISGVTGGGKEREYFEKAYKLEKSPVSGFLYALSLSRENKHKDAVKTAVAVSEQIEDEFVRFTLFQFLMTEAILMQNFPEALKYGRLCMEMARLNAWPSEIIETSIHFAMITIYMGRLDDASEYLIEAEAERLDDPDVVALANLKYRLERGTGTVESLTHEYDLTRELNLLSVNLFPNSRYFELSGMRSSKPFNIKGMVDDSGKKLTSKLDMLGLDKFEKFISLPGTNFKNQATRMVMSMGYRVTKEISNPEADGVNLLASSKEDVNKRALFRVRKWKDAKVSDVFLREMTNQMEELGASKGYVVGNFDVTEAGKKIIAASNGALEMYSGDLFEDLLNKTM